MFSFGIRSSIGDGAFCGLSSRIRRRAFGRAHGLWPCRHASSSCGGSGKHLPHWKRSSTTGKVAPFESHRQNSSTTINMRESSESPQIHSIDMDRSNGYEAVAAEFLARRGSAHSTGIGVIEVRKWARTLPHGATVIDLGCGPGLPITETLVAEGLNVFAVDAAPSFVEASRRNLPNTPIVCEAVQDSPPLRTP